MAAFAALGITGLGEDQVSISSTTLEEGATLRNFPKTRTWSAPPRRPARLTEAGPHLTWRSAAVRAVVIRRISCSRHRSSTHGRLFPRLASNGLSGALWPQHDRRRIRANTTTKSCPSR